MKNSNTVSGSFGLSGSIKIPGDKSISHRAVMFGSIAGGVTRVSNFLESGDCLSTISCFKAMGVAIERKGSNVKIKGAGFFGLKAPRRVLDAGNSGTTARLMLGILAGQAFSSKITGDASLRGRPMKRVTGPLRQMGAKITGRDGGNFAPLTVTGGKLSPINYRSKVASAQVKSCLLLAGLFAKGKTTVSEPQKSRDHTERMLVKFGVKLSVKGNKVSLRGGQRLKGTSIEVPGDISSAAFFLVAGSIVPGSKLTLQNVGTNPTRTGVLEVLKRMGAKIRLTNLRGGKAEPSADITVEYAPLKGVTVGGSIIPRLIDEIPALAAAASAAKGKTIFRNIGELRVKESDRIKTVCSELAKFGVKTKELPDGMIIYGGAGLKAARTESYGDHRIAMMAAVLGQAVSGKTIISDTACIGTSFPGFFGLLRSLQKKG